MKRQTLALLIGGLLLGGCGPQPASQAAPKTPEQALVAAVNKLHETKTARFTLNGTTHIQVPVSLLQGFTGAVPPGVAAPAAAPIDLSIPVDASGEIQFPARAHFTGTAGFQGQTQKYEVILYEGVPYLKDLQTGKWMAAPKGFSISQVGPAADPFSASRLFEQVKSVKRLEESTIDGTRVEHYSFVPDFQRIADETVKAMRQNGAQISAESEAALRDTLAQASGTGEVYIGKNDQLVRRVKQDLKFRVDLRELLRGLSGPTGLGSLPANAGELKLSGDSTLTVSFSKFNEAVNIAKPTT
jgi:hypothetical protein